MKGVVILPKYLSNHWPPKQGSDFSSVSSVTASLFYGLQDSLGFDLRYADEVSVSSTTDVVIMFGVPYHNRPNMIPGLLDLDSSIKLVMYPGDIQSYGNPICIENRLKVFSRSDLIISGSYEYFAEMYPQFLYKYKFLPLFFGPQERYVKLPFNYAPKMSCLLSGSINPSVYPLRSMLVKSRLAGLDYRSSTYAQGDAYAKLLNSYFCCVATPSIFNYAVAKYFEIPAAGSLLLAPAVGDLKLAGFIANKHYIPVTKEDVIEKISHCLKSPEEYDCIRRGGMNFVREKHSVISRVNQVKILLEEMFDR